MKKSLLILTLAFLTQTAFADSSVGCGLGQIGPFKKNSIVSAVLRMTTNATFSSQLFGITSGTSGCSQHSIVKNEMLPIHYAEVNLDEIKMQMAQGNGEYLVTFADTLGCTSLEAKERFMPIAQSSFTEVQTLNGVEMVQVMRNKISADQSLNTQCNSALL